MSNGVGQLSVYQPSGSCPEGVEERVDKTTDKYGELEVLMGAINAARVEHSRAVERRRDARRKMGELEFQSDAVAQALHEKDIAIALGTAKSEAGREEEAALVELARQIRIGRAGLGVLDRQILEARSLLESFIAKLDGEWERQGTDIAPSALQRLQAAAETLVICWCEYLAVDHAWRTRSTPVTKLRPPGFLDLTAGGLPLSQMSCLPNGAVPNPIFLGRSENWPASAKGLRERFQALRAQIDGAKSLIVETVAEE